MSRFGSFTWHGTEMGVGPVGWRRRALLRWVPYRTGDELRLGIRHRRVSEAQPVRGERLYLEVRRRDGPDREGARSEITEGRGFASHLSFGTVSFSGEYEVSALRYPGYAGGWEVVRRGVATIQVREDYRLPVLAIGLVLVALGAGIGALAVWALG